MKNLTRFTFILVWAFTIVGVHAQTIVTTALNEGGVYSFTSQRDTKMSITDPTDHRILCKTTSKTNQAQWWVLQPLASGGFALRNYSTGLYMQSTSGTSARYTSGSNRSRLYVKASPNSTSSKPLVTISSNSDFGGKSCLHDDANHNVVNWAAATTPTDNPASDWGIVAVEGLDAATIKEHFAELSGQVKPTDGVTVQIRNVETSTNISESSSGKLLAIAPNAEDYSQYWVMEQTSAGQFAFRNVKTGHYFNYTTGTGNGSVQTASATASKKGSYVLTETSTKWERTYHISSVTSQSRYFTHTTAGKAPTDTPEPYVVNTDSDDPRSHWVLIKADLDTREIEEAQLAFQAYTDIKNNASSYTTKLAAYFTDASCSELKAEHKSLSSEAFRAKLVADKLPEYLIRIAMKVKDNTWAQEDDMSRDFRVAKYQVYSHNMFAKYRMGMGYAFGRLSNPTGISVKSGDIVTFFCDQAAPSGSKLQIEAVSGTDSNANETSLFTLTKGVNIFSFSEDANLFVFYQQDDSKVNTPLANFPDVCVHIEGGHLQGYYDKTRGHNDATWKHLREKLLKHSDVVNIKTDNVVFCMNNKLTQQACPIYMERLLKAWDDMVESENELMGYNDTWIPGISKVQRNVYNFFSKDYYIGGLMMAGLYGVQCMESAISGIMNTESMESDGIWGPAHECGHLRQNLIEMVGTLESSNNLFSNVAVYKQGRTTHRGAAPKTVYDHFATGTHWKDYDIWETTHMLYQFYLYFHVNGIMPDFYPRVFSQLRQDPMDKNDRNNIHAGDEYLKLARTFCDVAQADLSEVFAAYGFFVPSSKYSVSENGSIWSVTTTQEEIDATLEYMHKFPKKLGNILFIDDRIQPVPATYEGHKANEMKKRCSGDPLGSASAGDLGHYTTFLDEPNLVNYYYTVSSTGKVTINGTGATGLVGFKVYDEAGKLAYLSNCMSFTLPAELRTQKYTLVAAMGDGTDIQLSTNLPVGVNQMDCNECSSQTNRIMDLQGRQVSTPVRGSIYIINGRKQLY